METYIQGPCGRLQASFWSPSPGEADGDPEQPRAACVVCHPHPLHGGSMKTNAVYRTARGLQTAGLAVLRFNFRGVGRSAGTHDGQGAEERDLEAGLDALESRYPDAELWAGGFSFGARTAASWARRDERVRRVVLIALPVVAYDCSFLVRLEKPGLLLMAERDDFGNLSELRQRFPDLYPGLEGQEIASTDHFFAGQTRELQERVRDYAVRSLGETP